MEANEISQTGTTAAYQDLPFEFKGNAKEYFGIWVVNILLTILTLGIYSAWAKVRNHKYFYGNTIVNNSSFDYLADPKVIFKGRMLAVLIFMLYSIVTNIFPLTAPIFGIAFLILLPWLVVRAMSFRMRNTSYRNIRFNFDADYSGAIKNFVGFALLVPFTLGLLYPYVIYRQKQFLVDKSGFGTAFFGFTGKAKEFYKVYGLIVLVAVVVGVAIKFTLFENLESLIAQLPDEASAQGMNPAAEAEIDPELNAQIGSVMNQLMIVMMLLYLVAFAYLKARIQNLIWNNVELEGNRFRSTLRVRDILWLYFSNTLAIVFSMGLLVPWAKVRMANYRLSRLTLLASGDMDQFVNLESEKISATGEEIGEVFDMDIGI